MYNVRMSSQRTNNDMNSLPPVVGLLVGLVSNDRKDKKKYAYLLVGWIYIKEAEKNVQGASFTLHHGHNQSIVQTAVHVVEIKYIGPSKVRNTIYNYRIDSKHWHYRDSAFSSRCACKSRSFNSLV
jgi:hypothetical protein